MKNKINPLSKGGAKNYTPICKDLIKVMKLKKTEVKERQRKEKQKTNSENSRYKSHPNQKRIDRDKVSRRC